MADQEYENKSVVKRKLQQVDYSLKKFNGRSVVWSKFTQVVDDKDNYTNYVACNKCRILFCFKHGSSGTSTLARHADRCFNSNCKVLSESKNEQKGTVQTTLSSYCKIETKCMARQDSEKLVNDFRPFTTLEGRGFLELAQTLVDLTAKYGYFKVENVMPARTTVSKKVRELSKDALDTVMVSIKEHLRQSHRVAFTTDMWTDNYKKKSFISLTCHYISDKWALKEVKLGCKEFQPEKKSAQNIQMEIVSLLTSLGFCVSDVQTKSYFVTDCGTNIKCALKNYKWYRCSAHVINTVLFHTFRFMQNQWRTRKISEGKQSFVTIV